jgi:flagellar motor protein MotB
MKQTVVYQGLFLIAFALYANERNQAHPVVIQKEIAEPSAPGEIPAAPELVALYQKLKIASVFTTPIDGVSLTSAPRALSIRIQSDELYPDGSEVAVEETWQPVLDQIGDALFAAGEPTVDLIFSVSTTLEKDAFTVSSARANWVLRYLERKYRFRVDQGKYRVTGLGTTESPRGKKAYAVIEIVIKPHNEN